MTASEEPKLEWAKLDLEIQKVMHDFTLRSLELDLKRRDLNIREREVELKDKEHQRSRWSNPLVIGILALAASVLTATATVVTNIFVARDKDQSDLLIEAIKGADAINARENLLFLADAGRLRDPEAIKRAAAAHSPALPGVTDSSGVIDSVEGKSESVLFGRVEDKEGNGIGNASVSCGTIKVPVEADGAFHCDFPQGRRAIQIHVTALRFQSQGFWVSQKTMTSLDSPVPLKLQRSK